MWNTLLQWNANSDPFSLYDIGEQVSGSAEHSIWTLFKAKRKSTREPLSLFRFDIKESSHASVSEAKQSLKRIKTLRHPSILKFVDCLENDKYICIFTESVVPLQEYLDRADTELQDTQLKFSIAYGLINVAKGLAFLNNDCNLNHNNINIHSIYVNSSGVWKIGGLDRVCSVDDSPSPPYDTLNKKYVPPEILDPTKARHPGGKFAVDSWGMGCLVWECFNKPLTPNSNVKTVGKMPKALSIHYNKLVQSSPKHRISPIDFINVCREAKIYFDLPSLNTIVALEEIQLIKDPDEKSKIFKSLENELESIPPDICKHKILSDLINAFEYGEAGPSIVDPIFLIGKLLDEQDYQTRLVPCIIKLYQCKDRGIRSKLLQQLDSYINSLNETVINEQIFPQIIQGFLDVNPTLRGQTIQSMFHLAPKLSANNLNEELLKHLTRLRSRDENGIIRASSTACLGRITKFLTSETQNTILLQSFLQTMKDPFPPARHAAIVAIMTNQAEVFSHHDCASKIMPLLCQLCLDIDQKVKQLAIQSLKTLIDRLENLCKITNTDEGEKPVVSIVPESSESIAKSS